MKFQRVCSAIVGRWCEKEQVVSRILTEAVAKLGQRLPQGLTEGCVKFVIEDAGVILVDGQGVRAAPENDVQSADVTLRARADVFEAILAGRIHPSQAFMQGKLDVTGDMVLAMKLASSMV